MYNLEKKVGKYLISNQILGIGNQGVCKIVYL